MFDQALSDDFPAHPRFEAEIKNSNLRKVYEVAAQAARREDCRAEVEKPLRQLLRQIANPLLLGEMGPDATHFVLGQHWKNHFSKKAIQAGSALTVGQLRKWLDDPRPMGLPKEVGNLVILLFAEQTNRTFFLHGGPAEVTLTALPDALELREWKGPSEAAWDVAVQRAGSILGIAVSPLLKSTNVTSLSTQAKAKGSDHRVGCQGYTRRLRERLTGMGITDAPRLKTAQAVLALIEKLHASNGDGPVGILAATEVATSEAAMSTCLGRAAELSATMDTFNWEILDAVGQLTDERRVGAEEVARIVREALVADEQAVLLAPALKEAQSKAVRLLTVRTPPASKRLPGPLPPEPPPVPPVQVTPKTIIQDKKEGLTLTEAQEQLEKLKKEQASGRVVTVSMAWKVESGGPGT